MEFYVENILIKTNIIELYKELLLFFKPFFKVSLEQSTATEEMYAVKLKNNEYSFLKNRTECYEDAEFIYGGKNNEQHYFLKSVKCKTGDFYGYYIQEQEIIYLQSNLGVKYILSNSDKKLFFFLRRLLRSKYLYSDLIQKNYVPLHAACVTKGNKAIAFLGQSGVGKTSAMLPLIEYFGYDLVASDLLFMSNKGQQIVGTPEKVRITPATLKQYSPKFDFLVRSTEKLAFSPNYFSFVFQCNIVAHTMLHTIVLPEINIKSSKNELSIVSSQLDLREYISPFFTIINQHKLLLGQEIYSNCNIMEMLKN